MIPAAVPSSWKRRATPENVRSAVRAASNVAPGPMNASLFYCAYTAGALLWSDPALVRPSRRGHHEVAHTAAGIAQAVRHTFGSGETGLKHRRFRKHDWQWWSTAKTFRYWRIDFGTTFTSHTSLHRRGEKHHTPRLAMKEVRRVLVVGGGVGGLTAATAFARDVSVVRNPAPTPFNVTTRLPAPSTMRARAATTALACWRCSMAAAISCA